MSLIEYIEELERQLAERDAEIAKYRDAPVVAWKDTCRTTHEDDSEDNDPVLLGYEGWIDLPDGTDLIVKPGESISYQTSTEELDDYVAEKLKDAQLAYEKAAEAAMLLNFKVEELTRQRDLAVSALNSVSALIDNSTGVAGLHLNGDVAPWEELRTGGRFESWLLEFDEALAAIKESEKAK